MDFQPDLCAAVLPRFVISLSFFGKVPASLNYRKDGVGWGAYDKKED
jgi:hypothetical protein